MRPNLKTILVGGQVDLIIIFKSYCFENFCFIIKMVILLTYLAARRELEFIYKNPGGDLTHL